MPLGRLRINAVRCLAEVDVDLGGEDCYFYGPNGAGKSSLLESVYLLARGRSFRTRDTRKLVRHGAERLTVYGEAWVGEAVHRLGITFGAGRLEKRRDGEPAAGMAELAALLPVHVVDPSSHQLVEGGPSERRRFLDWGVFHVEHRYLDAWRRYRRLLGQRNAALKTASSDSEVEVWTTALAEAGEVVDGFRRRYADALGPVVGRLGEALLGQSIRIEYRRGWAADTPLETALRQGLRQDREAGFTQAGPHRADLALRSAGGAVRDEASRGQQKLVAAALVLGQVQVQGEGTAVRPTILVDDPAAELDPGSLERLREALRKSPGQLLITSLSEVQLPAAAGARVFHVEQGRVLAVL